MKFGDILGSISPAYGIASGQGLGGMAGNLSPMMMLIKGLGHHHQADPAATADAQDAAPMAAPGAQTAAAQDAQPMAGHGGLGGPQTHGAPMVNGILAALRMMAPGGRAF